MELESTITKEQKLKSTPENFNSLSHDIDMNRITAEANALRLKNLEEKFESERGLNLFIDVPDQQKPIYYIVGTALVTLALVALLLFLFS